MNKMLENKKANDWQEENHINPFNNKKKTPRTKEKRCCVGISNKSFYAHPPSSHPQSRVNSDTMITCD